MNKTGKKGERIQLTQEQLRCGERNGWAANVSTSSRSLRHVQSLLAPSTTVFSRLTLKHYKVPPPRERKESREDKKKKLRYEIFSEGPFREHHMCTLCSLGKVRERKRERRKKTEKRGATATRFL